MTAISPLLAEGVDFWRSLPLGARLGGGLRSPPLPLFLDALSLTLVPCCPPCHRDPSSIAQPWAPGLFVRPVPSGNPIPTERIHLMFGSREHDVGLGPERAEGIDLPRGRRRAAPPRRVHVSQGRRVERWTCLARDPVLVCRAGALDGLDHSLALNLRNGSRAPGEDDVIGILRIVDPVCRRGLDPALFFPALACCWYYLLPWQGVLLFAVFPHVPSVFGPVVVAHAVIFVHMSLDFTRRIALVAVVAGGLILSLLATVGIALQVLNLPPSFPAPLALISLTAGLTFLGYALVATGYRLESAPLARQAMLPSHPLSRQ